MACHSLRHRGEELLGAVIGPGAPVDAPWTSGIPLLHPWANRLGGFAYVYDGVVVTLAPGSPALYLEQHGLPVHGLRAAVAGWEVLDASPQRLVAGRELAGLAEFPFDHRVELAAELSATTLALTTTVTATGERPVPIVFGHHPYLRLPGVPRAEWEVVLPVGEHLTLDDRLVPTGERRPAGDLDGPLAARTFDDGYTLATGAGPFVLRGGGRQIEVAFERGYPYAQIFAPDIADVICFEPMTAPADALRHSPAAVAPGEAFSARFSVRVGASETLRESVSSAACEVLAPAPVVRVGLHPPAADRHRAPGGAGVGRAVIEGPLTARARAGLQAPPRAVPHRHHGGGDDRTERTVHPGTYRDERRSPRGEPDGQTRAPRRSFEHRTCAGWFRAAVVGQQETPEGLPKLARMAKISAGNGAFGGEIAMPEPLHEAGDVV